MIKLILCWSVNEYPLRDKKNYNNKNNNYNSQAREKWTSSDKAH